MPSRRLFFLVRISLEWEFLRRSCGDGGFDGIYDRAIRRYPRIGVGMGVQLVGILRWTVGLILACSAEHARKEDCERLLQHGQTCADDAGIGFYQSPYSSVNETPCRPR